MIVCLKLLQQIIKDLKILIFFSFGVDSKSCTLTFKPLKGYKTFHRIVLQEKVFLFGEYRQKSRCSRLATTRFSHM